MKEIVIIRDRRPVHIFFEREIWKKAGRSDKSRFQSEKNKKIFGRHFESETKHKKRRFIFFNFLILLFLKKAAFWLENKEEQPVLKFFCCI